MATRKFKWMTAGSVVLASGMALVGYNLIAAQGEGVLAQAPLNNQVQTPPAFIMAVDDSGSMTFQTQFPGMDGEGCWDTTQRSFFDRNGALSTTGNCDYFHILPGPRIDTGRYGVPPLDTLGFARSSAYNPSYYNPSVKYDPWIDGTGTPYPDASTAATRIDPRNTDTVPLASSYYTTNANNSFRMQNGMLIPAGTSYYYNNNLITEPADYIWARGVQTVYFRYWPATFFTPASSDDLPQLEGIANAYAGMTRTKVNNACGAGCAMWKYTITTANPAALQNFANWFSYYGNRNRAMIAGMTRSLAEIQNLRVGYFRINQNGSYNSGTDANKRLAIRDMAVDTDKQALFRDMTALTASGGTPNRQAVYSAALQFTRTDAAAPIQLACQKNAVMLFTDGYSNGGGPTVGNTDQGMGAPFSDGNSSTMADIVSQYYIDNAGRAPLRPDLLAGQVPVVNACKTDNPDKKLDCQANLHLNFYGVTLGARGNLFNPDAVQDPYTDASIYGNWPPRQDDQRSTVDDIWHAAVNTRGEYINARTPAEITTAMRRVLSSVTSGGSPSGGTGASGARIGAGSISVAPVYAIANEGTDWYSRLNASQVTVDAVTRAVVLKPLWEASEQLQAAASRSVFFTKNGTMREFTGSNVTLDDLCNKSTALYPGMSRCGSKLAPLGVTPQTAVNYLRGDTTGEKRNNGTLRDRTTRLGDIVTSSPVISAPIDDYGYRRFGGALAASYATYLDTKAATGKYMVYVGANDGMLHAFNGGMDAKGVVTAGGGTEAFAYIPSTALGHLGNLLLPYNAADPKDQGFDHRYFVDGQISVGDSNYGGGWHTTLVGAAGAGGRSVFALDVTAGSTFGSTSKLWEISDLDTSLNANVRNNIGFVLGKPVIVPVLNSAGVPVWKAIFGNGFNSANGKAVLFMVDIGTGTPNVTMIEAVETGSGVPSGSNGLGSIVAIDRWGGTGQNQRLRDGYTDTVYGTDQKGAIWKFDLRGTPSNLSVPLFTSRPYVENGRNLRQPITGGITAGSGTGGGVMLFFGTGSFSFNNDPQDTSLQSLYAVNDTASGAIGSTLTRANLTAGVVTTTGTSRMLSQGTPPAGGLGWYIDLPLRERFVGNPSLANGIVFMPTYAPLPGGGGCSSSGDNWLFGLQPLTGSGALGRATLGSPTGTQVAEGTAALKTMTSGASSGAPVRDVKPGALPRLQPPSGTSSPGGGPSGPPPGLPANTCTMPVPNGTETIYVPYPCGRQSWRQIQ